MMGLELPNIWWIAAGYYTLAVVSAVVPWVNAEVVMLSAVPLARSPIQLGVLVALVTLGQMTGKSIMYWISRNATRPRAPHLQNAINRWRDRLQRHPRSALGVMLISSTIGLPPFYLVAMAAGALNVAFGRFLAVGTVGRLVHFALLAFVPRLVGRNL
jgi:membrane protein YqaA with SNARE-associated domain